MTKLSRGDIRAMLAKSALCLLIGIILTACLVAGEVGLLWMSAQLWAYGEPVLALILGISETLLIGVIVWVLASMVTDRYRRLTVWLHIARQKAPNPNAEK